MVGLPTPERAASGGGEGHGPSLEEQGFRLLSFDHGPAPDVDPVSAVASTATAATGPARVPEPAPASYRFLDDGRLAIAVHDHFNDAVDPPAGPASLLKPLEFSGDPANAGLGTYWVSRITTFWGAIGAPVGSAWSSPRWKRTQPRRASSHTNSTSTPLP